MIKCFMNRILFLCFVFFIDVLANALNVFPIGLNPFNFSKYRSSIIYKVINFFIKLADRLESYFCYMSKVGAKFLENDFLALEKGMFYIIAQNGDFIKNPKIKDFSKVGIL